MSARDHLRFAAMHVHAFVFAWLAPAEMPWLAASVLYCCMMVSCGAVLLVPIHLRRAIAFALTALGAVLFGAFVPIASPLGWTALVLLLKIVADHMIGPEQEDG